MLLTRELLRQGVLLIYNSDPMISCHTTVDMAPVMQVFVRHPHIHLAFKSAVPKHMSHETFWREYCRWINKLPVDPDLKAFVNFDDCVNAESLGKPELVRILLELKSHYAMQPRLVQDSTAYSTKSRSAI